MVTKLRVAYPIRRLKPNTDSVCVCLFLSLCRIFNYVTRVTLTENAIFLSLSFHSIPLDRDVNYIQDLRINYIICRAHHKFDEMKKERKNVQNERMRRNAIERYRIIDQVNCYASHIQFHTSCLHEHRKIKGIFFPWRWFFATFLFTIFGLIFFSAIGMQRKTTLDWNVNLLLKKCGVCIFAR